MTGTTVRFFALSDEAAHALLTRQRVGRIAFTFHDRVDIEPIAYVASGEWLYFRTSQGTKLSMLAHNPWVAFQVDEISGPFDWKSVVLHGTVYFITGPTGSSVAHDEALAAIRSLDPHALTPEDVVPDRTALFRIHIDTLVGRAASSKAES